MKLHPAFVQNMQLLLADEASLFLNAIELPSNTAIRINERKASIDVFNENKHPISWCDNAFLLEKRPSFTKDVAFHQGMYYVQEASSMILHAVCKQLFPNPSQLKILDMCAAPGGKTTLLSSYFYGNNNSIVANEIDGKRNNILVENVCKWGLDNVLVTKNKSHTFLHLPELFDFIVLDAPCSGEGMFRKDKFAQEQWNEKLVWHCAQMQDELLQHALCTLKTGGYLFYSTCTFNTTENENHLRKLIESNSVECVKITLKQDWNISVQTIDGVESYKFLFHKSVGEGFSFFVIKKTAKYNLDFISSSKIERTINWNDFPEQSYIDEKRTYIQIENEIYAVPDSMVELLNVLKYYLKIEYIPTHIATYKAHKLIPNQALALSIHFNKKQFAHIPLTEAEALKYIALQTFAISNTDKEFQIVTYQDIPLGFIHNLGNRFNNLYPKTWRIRSL